jgi:hypothetical protein
MKANRLNLYLLLETFATIIQKEDRKNIFKDGSKKH